MPFSRSRTCTASTISLDIPSALQQVAPVDVRIRDGHDPAGRGDGDLVVARPHELAREAPAAVVGLARDPYARAAPQEALEVVRLRERPLGTGRRDLETDLREEVAQVTGYPLAERKVHAVRMIHHDAHG